MINSWLSFPWKFAFMKTIFIVWAKDLELHNDTPCHKHSEVSWAEHLSAISICIQKNINGKKQMSLTQEEFRNQNGSPKRRTKKVFSCFQKAPQNFFCAVHSVKLILISWVQTFPLKTNTYLGKKIDSNCKYCFHYSWIYTSTVNSWREKVVPSSPEQILCATCSFYVTTNISPSLSEVKELFPSGQIKNN